MSGAEQEKAFDNRLLPVMMEAVDTVRMVLFKAYRDNLRLRHPDRPGDWHRRLAGAVLGNLFGLVPEDQEQTAFIAANRELAERELRGLGAHIAPLLPLLTDALRMKAICDNQRGVHSLPSLLMARELGLLLEERDLPLPSVFMTSVRKLAVEQGLVEGFGTPLSSDGGAPA